MELMKLMKLMELITCCSVVATLRVSPNRSQFFQYERVSLSCGWRGDSSGGTVMRNTSRHTNQACVNHGPGSGSSYVLSALYPSDSGRYWCGSAGGSSRAVHITVSDGPVILESPALPVVEGDEVVLRCSAKTPSSSTRSSSTTSSFYRDGILIRRSSTGTLPIHSISMAEGGVYRCSTGAGESPESQLTVVARGSAPSSESCCNGEGGGPPAPGPQRVLLAVGGGGVAALLLLVCLWSSHRGIRRSVDQGDRDGDGDKDGDRDGCYAVVTISQNLPPQRVKGPEAGTFYSPVRPGGPPPPLDTPPPLAFIFPL